MSVLASDTAWQKAEPFSTFDAFPVLSQAKSAYQWFCGDEAGARVTWERCKTYGLVVSQVCSCADYFQGFPEEAASRQKAFAENFSRVFFGATESLPLTAPFVASAHYCAGDRQRSSWVAKKATRSCLVFTAGASLSVATGPVASSAHLLMAAGAGALTGICADALMVARPSVPRPLSPGQRFDWAAMRFLDALRAMAGFDLVLVFWPEHASSMSIWVEPISVGDAARLVMGKPTTAEDASLVNALDHVNSGVDHVFVMWKTNKGHIFLSERLHDGRVLVEDLHRGTMLPFAKGKAMAWQDLGERHAAGATGHGTSPAAATVPKPAVQAVEAPAQAAKLISGGRAQLFKQQALSNGPTVAQFQELARAQSVAGYDLMQANCQHYVQDFWKFAGAGKMRMPNQEFLNLFKIFGSPSHGAKVHEVGVLGNAAYALKSSPLRFVVDAALIKLPVVPPRFDETEEEEPESATPRPAGPQEELRGRQEGVWV